MSDCHGPSGELALAALPESVAVLDETSSARTVGTLHDASGETSPVARHTRPAASRTSGRARRGRHGSHALPAVASHGVLDTMQAVYGERDFRRPVQRVNADRAAGTDRHRQGASAAYQRAVAGYGAEISAVSSSE